MSALAATARRTQRGAVAAALRPSFAGFQQLAASFAGPNARIRSFVTVTDGKVQNVGLPEARGLYDPKLEKDSCGVGCVACRPAPAA